MKKSWQDSIKGAFEGGKKKLDEGYDRIKENERIKSEQKAREEIEKAEEIRKQKIKEERRRRQDERRRIKRETINSKIMLVAKILCLVGVLIWTCWFVIDFVHNYDTWIAKYNKWSIEYEDQAPAREQARIKYKQKMQIAQNLEEDRRLAKGKRMKEEEERKARYEKTIAEQERIIADRDSGKIDKYYNKKPTYSQCIEHGKEYYKSLGSYPRLSTGEDAYNKIREGCRSNSNAYYYK